MKNILLSFSLCFLLTSCNAFASLIIHTSQTYEAPNTYKSFTSASFEITQLDFIEENGGTWWAAGENSIINKSGNAYHTFKSPILDITAFKENYAAVVLNNGDVLMAGNDYLSYNSFTSFQKNDFPLKMLDYSANGGWWGASNYTVMNKSGSVTHTFDKKIVDITSYSTNYVAVTLETGEFYITGNNYESQKSLTNLHSKEEKIVQLDHNPQDGWWAASKNRVFNKSGTFDKTFETEVLHITPISLNSVAIVLADQKTFEKPENSISLSSPSFNLLNSQPIISNNPVSEPDNLLLMAFGLFILIRRNKKASHRRPLPKSLTH